MDLAGERDRVAQGLSDLHLAVITGQIRQAANLLSRSDRARIVNEQDYEGTTPLMAAVLTGQLQMVRLLLQNGASTRIRDHQGKKAKHYTRASLFPRKVELYKRLGMPPTSPKQRSMLLAIGKLLRFPAALNSCRRDGRHHYSLAVFSKVHDTIGVLRPDSTFKVSKPNLEGATVGFIVSAAQPEVKTVAVSGWNAGLVQGPNVLDSCKYLELVRKFAGLLGFQIPITMRDNNGVHLPMHAGRFLASHVEKKLAVFWILATLKAVLCTTDLNRYHELREADIPKAWQEAWIFLDHSPCGNCWDFLGAIKETTGIRIYVETLPFLVGGIREGVAGCDKCSCDRCKKRFAKSQERAQLSPSESESDEDTVVADVTASAGPVRSGNRDTEAGLQPTTCSPPKRWRVFVDPLRGTAYGKPVGRPSDHLRGTVPNCSDQAPKQTSTQPATKPVDRSSRRLSSAGPSRPNQRHGQVNLHFVAQPRVRLSSLELNSGDSPDQCHGQTSTQPAARRTLQQPSGAENNLEARPSVGQKQKGKQPATRRTIQQSIAALNLQRYHFDGRALPPAGISTSDAVLLNNRERQGANEPAIARAVNTSMDKVNPRFRTASRGQTKSRAQSRTDERIQSRSAFARAVAYHRGLGSRGP
ncbi:hypothetical protein VTJ83DRAFT_1310 [Remersonia thermophila]|uniref:Single-strand DNA deaminase toxin A-like C-terminal domain-containing protein n=1 Tax=Remersonia thermophila TaxID=72144 RepID=A0ABR4DPB2_9PEZI